MPTPMPSGSIEKLVLSAYEDPGFDTPASIEPNSITVMINPSTYSQSMEIAYTKEEAAGGTGQSMTFNRSVGTTLALSLILDGTGAVPTATGATQSVDEQIADLRRLAFDVNGTTHSPNYVKLAWGSLLFKGRLQTLGIDYTLFAPDGTPLRATVKVDFAGFHENLDARASQNLSSPDLTHAVTVRQGDTLPLICHRIYGDSRFYLKVAQHNRLDNFRMLAPGSTLLLPPLEGASS